MTTESCLNCGLDFEDINYIPSLPLAKRVYCNDCLNKLWKEFIRK
jgi:hypothetical protein